MKLLTFACNPKATPKECLKLKTLLGSTPKLQVVAGATMRKKDCMQFPALKKKAHYLVTMEELFDDD